MINLSYNFSPNINDLLKKIDNLRVQILTTPISPNKEIKLRWDANIKKIQWSLTLHENNTSKAEIARLLSTLPSDKLKPEEKEVLGYKKALDYINQEWLVSEKSITSKTIINLHDLCSEGRLTGKESSIKQVLSYLQASTDHPVVKAAILQIALLSLAPFSRGNGRTARLSSYLMLSKFGYDFKGLLCLDEYFKKDLTSYKEHIKRITDGNNLSFWLEYFAQGIKNQLEKALTDILQEKYSVEMDENFFELNDRQKQILIMLEIPDSTITNKKVQKMFKISQITASRDLAKLTVLGLLLSHGKGRSVYYTRNAG